MSNIHLFYSIIFLAIFSCKKEEVKPDPIVTTPIIEVPNNPIDTTNTDTTNTDTTITPPPVDHYLTITITDIRDVQGEMNIAIFDNEAAFDSKTNWVLATEQTVTGSSMQIKIKNLTAGVYAVTIYHDKNNNGELDTNGWTGVPQEGFGFSNDAMGLFGPPNFEQAKITIEAATDKDISIDLVHY
jgi:uncharacterized protein (DUF2141 family)